eukprot:359750-Pleurochrysis_carterae.AAC.1
MSAAHEKVAQVREFQAKETSRNIMIANKKAFMDGFDKVTEAEEYKAARAGYMLALKLSFTAEATDENTDIQVL